MDQDLVLMYGTQKDVLDNPVFKRLDAVREDRVVYLDLTDQLAGALGFASALSLGSRETFLATYRDRTTAVRATYEAALSADSLSTGGDERSGSTVEEERSRSTGGEERSRQPSKTGHPRPYPCKPLSLQ